MIQKNVKKCRLEWLDSMRGFTMILVVLFHIQTLSFAQESTATSFMLLFRMPLFFLVSGFLAYKADFIWNKKSYWLLVIKKIKIQVMPTIVFFLVYCAICYDSFLSTAVNFLADATKGGYWFTWVLLQMFLIYYTLCAITKNGGGKILYIVWGVSMFFYIMSYMISTFDFSSSFYGYSSFTLTMRNLNYFIFGNIVRRNFQVVEYLFDSKWFFPLSCIICVITTLECEKFCILSLELDHIVSLLATYSWMFIILAAFRYYKDVFSQKHVLGKILSSIGRRTLDVYLIHYLLLPTMPIAGIWLKTMGPNFLLEFSMSLVVALLVILGCFIISDILRISPFFKNVLFGR